MHAFLDYVAFGLLGLLPIANPLTSATVLLALTGRYPAAERTLRSTAQPCTRSSCCWCVSTPATR